MEDPISFADLEVVADQVRRLKLSNFQDQSLAISLFELLKRLFEAPDGESTPAVPVAEDQMIPDQLSQPRKKVHEARVAPLNNLLATEELSTFLMAFLVSPNPVLLNNAAAILMIVTNSFERSRLQNCIVEGGYVPVLIKLITCPNQTIQFWSIGILRCVGSSRFLTFYSLSANVQIVFHVASIRRISFLLR